MGINNFFKWIYKTYPSAVSNINQEFYDHVYIDINVILHRIVYSSPDENTLLGKLCSYINNILLYIIPTKTLTFAIDGISPFAKIILQRKRRLTYIKSNKDNIPDINPLCFTPGTYFMNSLSDNLSDYFTKLKKIYKVKVIELFIGSGEAELKIINQLLYHNSINISNMSESHCIFSSDADIVVIASSIGCFHRLLTLNHDITKNSYNIHKNKIYIHNTTNIINVNELLLSHSTNLAILLNLNDAEINDFNLNKIGKDFSFVSLFMGNDYIPKLSFVTFDKIWASYFDAFVSINTTCCNIQKQNTEKTPNDMIFLINDDLTINIYFIKIFLGYIINQLPKQYLKPFNLTNNHNQYYEYIYGLLWCFKTYNKGFCNKLDYMCSSSHIIHPLGLLLYFEFNNLTLIQHIYYDIDKLYVCQIDDEIYATLILPKFGRKFIEYFRDINFEDNQLNNILKILYDVEECNLCDQYHDKLSKLYIDQHIIIKNMKKIKDNQKELNCDTIDEQKYKEDFTQNNKLKKEITDELYNFRSHNLIHKDITINNINEICITMKKNQNKLKNIKIMKQRIKVNFFKNNYKLTKPNLIYLF